jgi:hypothetical protein
MSFAVIGRPGVVFAFGLFLVVQPASAQGVVSACTYPGATAGQKIAAAIAAIAPSPTSTGVTIDARCFTGDNNDIDVPLLIDKPVTLLLGHANFYVRHTITINVPTLPLPIGQWQRTVQILGAGIGSTRLQGATGDVNKPTIAIGTAASELQRGVHIADMALTGTTGSPNGTAIVLTRTRDSVLERLSISAYKTSGTAGIAIYTSSMFNTIRDVRVNDANQGIVIAGGTGDDVANRNLIENAVIALIGPGAGVRIGPNAQLNTVRDSNFESNTGQTDVLIEGETFGTRILDSHFEGCSESRLHGVMISSLGGVLPRAALLSGLDITGFRDRGVVLMDAKDVKITQTHFWGMPGNTGAIVAFNSTGVGVALTKSGTENQNGCSAPTPTMHSHLGSTFTFVP